MMSEGSERTSNAGDIAINNKIRLILREAEISPPGRHRSSPLGFPCIDSHKLPG